MDGGLEAKINEGGKLSQTPSLSVGILLPLSACYTLFCFPIAVYGSTMML